MALRAVSSILVVLAACAPAYAQAPAEPRGFVALKLGSMHEQAEDGLSQTSGALGGSAGFRLSQRWMLDVELSDNGAGSPAHRETLFSVSAIRSFRENGSRPFIALGLTAGRNQETGTSCFADRVPFGGTQPVQALVDCSEPDVHSRVPETFSGGSSFLLVGGGVSIPLWRRARLVPELRIHLAPTAVIVRPGLGLAIVF